MQVLVVAILLLLAIPARGQDCDRWSTPWFFEEATVEEVRACLASGENPNARFEIGRILHTVATMKGKRNVIEALLEGGANPNAPDRYGKTPLHRAAEGGDASIVGALLEAGADPNAVDKDGNTSLYNATLGGDPAIIGYLLDAGAELGVSGGVHLATAVSSSHLAMVEALLAGGADPNHGGGVLLLEAVRDRDLPIAKALLDGGARPNVTDGDGRTALYRAVVDHEWSMVEVLLAYGADPMIGNPDSSNFLFRVAIYSADVAIIEALYEAAGNPPTDLLGIAALRGNLAIVELLLAAGADPNGSSAPWPLDDAIAAGNPSIANALLEAGANPNATGLGDRTILQNAINSTFLRLTVEWDQDSRSFGYGASKVRQPTADLFNRKAVTVRLLLEANADPNGCVLWRAVRSTEWGFPERTAKVMVDALLAAGANKNERCKRFVSDKKSSTALQEARRLSLSSIIQSLRQR